MRKTIFVCDDDTMLLILVRDILLEKGFEVEVFSDHLALLSRLSKATPSLIILDLQMPEIWGDELTRVIKSREETRDIPIVIASSSINGKEKSELAGADGFVPKYNLVEEIELVVERILVPKEN